MVDRVKIQFSIHPQTYEEGVARLTPANDSRIYEDPNLATLSSLRQKLEETSNNKELRLGQRLCLLTQGDMKLLEENGFRRGVQLFRSDWSIPPIIGMWGGLLDDKERDIYEQHSYWRVTRMTPGYPNSHAYLFVCIHRNWDMNLGTQGENQDSEFVLGLITQKEFRELKKELELVDFS